MAEVEELLRQVVNHDEKRITDTSSWYSGRLNGDDLFVIYSTEYPGNPMGKWGRPRIPQTGGTVPCVP